MKKNKMLIIIMTVIALLITIVIYIKNTYALGENEYITSKTEMQDIVVSTALSYFYNHGYSNYEQHAMDKRQSDDYDKGTFLFRNMSLSPEDVNRGNRLNVDCSAFTFMTYLYSIGYDMSEYLSLFDNDKYKYIQYNYNSNKFEYINQQSSLKNVKDTYYKLYYNYGHEAATYTYSKIASHDLAGCYTNGNSCSFTDNMGDEYKNNSNTNKNISVYFYKTKDLTNKEYSETEEEKEKIRQNIKDTLEPGDIIVYRRRSRETNEVLSGHAILYVGGAINPKEKGIIHSTGSDYTFDDENYENITINDESNGGFSIRYDTLDYFFSYSNGIFGNNADTATYSISILRPINKYCDKNDNCIIKKDGAQFPRYKTDDYSLSNSIARKELSNLRIEQYQTYETHNESKYPSKSILNSLNNGDKIAYKLYMKNESKLGYCLGAGGSPTYNNQKDCITPKCLKPNDDNNTYETETACKEAGYKWKPSYTWKTRDEGQTYNGLTITGIVPKGTIFKECTPDCKYSEEENTVVWENVSFNETGYRTYTYEVIVDQDSDLTNSGMIIETSSGNKLHMGEIKTKVNPTITKKDIEKIENTIETVGNNATSQLDYINKLYKNTYGDSIDLSILTKDNIKNAIFKNASGTGYNVFTKTIDTEVSKISNENYKIINKMLVPGMYGGRLVKGNDNLDRTKYLTTFSYEYGDIIISFKNNAENMEIYMYAGRDNEGSGRVLQYNQGEVIEYNGDTTPTGYKMLTKVFAQDLFVVLRPSRLGTTVRLNYEKDNDTVNESLVMFDKYKNLPKKEDKTYTVEFDNTYLDSSINSITSKSKFEWYNGTTKVLENNNLVSTNTHTLNGKWSEYSEIELPSTQKNGYEFKGWYSDSSLEAFVGNAGDKITPTKNMTLYSKWKENNTNEVTITYHKNDGTNEVITSKTEKDSLIEKIADPVREGYVFKGWYTEEECETEFNFNNKATSDVNLYAKWELIKYNVKFSINDGTSEIFDSQVVTHKSKAVKPITNPEREGYVFKGWYTEEECENEYKFNNEVTENLILYAKWEEKAINEYNVVIHSNNGTDEKNTIKVKENEKISMPSIPEREGYTFKGWYTTAECKTEFDFNSVVTSNLNIYAKWEQNEEDKYVINYYLNDGTDEVYKTNTLVKDTVIEQIDNPEREGYEFKGWYDEPTNGEQFEFGKEITKNINLFAHWEVKKYIVTYYWNDTKDNFTVTNVNYGTMLSEDNIPKKEGYTFKGWHIKNADDKEEKYNFNSMVTKDLSLYAKWEPQKSSKEDEEIKTNSKTGSNIIIFTMTLLILSLIYMITKYKKIKLPQ